MPECMYAMQFNISNNEIILLTLTCQSKQILEE